MKTRHVVALCWLQVALAVISIVLSFISALTHPALQMSFNAKHGTVREVFRGGAAERAGLRAGDRLVTIGGDRIGETTTYLFDAEAHRPLSVTYERDGVMRTTSLTPATQEEERRAALHAGGGRALWAAYSYLVFPTSAWMLMIGVLLLVVRARSYDARIAALTFIYWAGGNFLGQTSGMGPLMRQMPTPLATAIFVVDSLFIALFFAACLHFAIIFPSNKRPAIATHWTALPYVLALPIFIESALQAIDSFLHITRDFRIPFEGDIYVTLGPTMLVAATALLAYRFRGTIEVNARRRLQLMFVALLAGVVPFVLLVILDRIEAPYTVRQSARLLQWLGTISGSLIFAVAVVRHRTFGVRVLVRRSIQYALARRTLMIASALPVIALAAFLYRHRDDSLRTLITARPGVYLAIIIPLVVALRYRARLLDALDRRYFREQYDARQMLLHVVSLIRSGADSIGVARTALAQISGALHPTHISLWRPDALDAELRREITVGVTTDAPSLAIQSPLVALLAADDEPFDIDHLRSSPILKRMPQSEREWIAATDAHLLVPLRRDSTLLGLLLLGERLSEEPYSREDRELLRVLAVQLAAAFHDSAMRSSPAMVWNPPAEPVAALTHEISVCPSCKRCYPEGRDRCDVDGTALLPEEGVPQVIEDKYELRKLLGRGGMGSVFLAKQKRLNRPVAIKILLSHLVGSSSMRSRFEREARIIARLSHNNIVTVHDFGVLPNGHAYLVMEYLEGKTLRTIINGRPMPFDEMLSIIEPVADAVHTAHQTGVVHRDLKPDNIMVLQEFGKTATPKVLDFGLAKLQELPTADDATLPHPTQSGSIVGTLPYMAPELLSGKPADARSDQYSLGLIVYEALTGRHPFEGNDLASIVLAHTQTPVPPLWERANVSDTAAAAVHRALAKQPDDRFPTTAEFISALTA